MAYAFVTTDSVTFDPTVAIMTYEPQRVPMALGGQAYVARSVIIQRSFFNTKTEAHAFAALQNNGQNYRVLSALAKAKAAARAAALNATLTA